MNSDKFNLIEVAHAHLNAIDHGTTVLAIEFIDLRQLMVNLG